MIILDREEEQIKLDNFNGPTLRLPERTFNRSSISLPDYQTSQQQHNDPQGNTERRFGPKFWRAALYAFAGYIFLSIVIGVPLIVIKLRRRAASYSSWVPPPSWNAPISSSNTGGGFLTITPGDQDCSEWNTTSHSNGTFLATLEREYLVFDTFAVESDYSYDISTARPLFGNLRVDINPNKLIKTLQVSVHFEASSQDLLDNTQFCFSNDNTGRGLQIGVPTDLGQSDLLTFNIVLLLPHNQSKQFFRLNNFATYLPLFRQDFGHLAGQYIFSDARIEGPLSNITIKSMRGDKVAIKSSLAPIVGTFNITQSLSLDTIGSPIFVDASLEPIDDDVPTSLTATTGNGEIRANITLANPRTDPDDDGDSITYIAELSTFNGPMNVNVLHSPISQSSNLFLRVQNNLGSANVSLDQKFVGTFDVQTKLAPVTVLGTAQRAAKPLADTGATFYTVDSAERSYGWIGLGPKPSALALTQYGHVEVTSSMSPVTLLIEGVESSHTEDPP